MSINALNPNVTNDLQGASGTGEVGDVLTKLAGEVMGRHGINPTKALSATRNNPGNPGQDIGQLAHQQLGLLGTQVFTRA